MKQSPIITPNSTFNNSSSGITLRSVQTPNSHNVNGRHNVDFLKRNNPMTVANNINSILATVGKKVILIKLNMN